MFINHQQALYWDLKYKPSKVSSLKFLTLNGVVQGGTSNILNILVSLLLLLLVMLLLPLLLLLLLWLLLTKVLDRFHNHLVLKCFKPLFVFTIAH
jgi:hypothetical protein